MRRKVSRPPREAVIVRCDYSTVNSPTTLLHKITLAEGVSFLLLLGIAMPMKYALGYAIAVKIAGWIHGVLFISLCLALFRVWRTAKWPISRCAMVFAAALLPLGPFILDRRMDSWDEEFQSGHPVEK